MSTADLFDHALDGVSGDAGVSRSISALVAVANEVADALAAVRLSRAEQDHIYARSLALLEEAVAEHRRGWQRVLRVQHPAPVLVGGAAITLGAAAAIGWAVVHGRRPHAPVAA